jgi:hypothetical protein
MSAPFNAIQVSRAGQAHPFTLALEIDCLQSSPLVPVPARLPAQLNGKQKEPADPGDEPNLRCPRNGTADEAAQQ